MHSVYYNDPIDLFQLGPETPEPKLIRWLQAAKRGQIFMKGHVRLYGKDAVTGLELTQTAVLLSPLWTKGDTLSR